MDAKLSEPELKAKREKKRDELIQKELDSYKEIDEKLKRAEKLPRRVAAEGEYVPPPDPSSWSSGRESKRELSEDEKRKQREAWTAVEAVLTQLAADEEFQRDMNRPSFDKALRHWTNETRLPSQEARALFDEDSYEFKHHIKPGLAKLNRLQAACRVAGIGVPIDALRKRRTTVFEPKPKPRELTAEEKKKLEQQRREKARKEFEDKIMADIPPPQPFSWKKFARQLLFQLVLMACIMLYFHVFMRPDLEESIREAEQLRQSEAVEANVDDAEDIIELGPDSDL